MEDKKLNFNRPLLSVRRSAPTLPLENVDASKTGNSHPVIPRLPPHRPELKSGPITNPGSVPFLWERTPGQPKEEIKPQAPGITIPPVVPKLPPGRYKGSKNRTVNVYDRGEAVNATCDENVKHVENSGETMEEKDSDSVESDGAYVDALESLSMTEHRSFFLNCSMSELNGLDDVEPSRNFSKDPQNQAFMMDRFLPAAKAMAMGSELKTHHAAPRRQPEVVEEEPLHVKQRMNPSLQRGPSFATRYSHFHETTKDQEDSDDDYDHRRCNLTAPCGLLPQFCFKSSFCLLNPIASMSVRTRVPMPGKILTPELDEGKANLGNESGHLKNHSTSAYCAAQAPSTTISEEKGVPGNYGSHGKASKTFQELLAEQDSSEESDSGVAVEESNDSEKQVPRATALNHSRQLPASPPLPKSPSDSWLCRTLPSKSSKNPTLRSYLCATTDFVNQGSKAPASDRTKWETLVKTTKMQEHRRLLHHSEGILTAIPET